MKKKAALFLGLVCLMALSMTHSPLIAEPQIHIPDGTFNFGRIPQHITVTHDFWVKSVGTDTLRILEIDPGCGCTQIPLSDSLIAPGDSTRLQIVLDTRAFRGRIFKKPKIVTNADSAAIIFKLYGEMELDPATATPLRIIPHEIEVSQFTSKPRRRGKFKITNLSEETFTLVPIDTAIRSFAIRLPESIAPGDTAEAFIVIHKEATETDFAESITFEATGQTERVRYSVPVIRTYRPRK